MGVGTLRPGLHGTPPEKGETESKTIVTVGDFARDCIAPHMDAP